MGGDPDLAGSLAVIDSVVRGGADVLEVGIPFSDPIADGTSIQAAGVRALSAGTRPGDVMRLVRDVRKVHDVPVALMTYFNPIFSMGVDRFLDESKRSGVDGVIIPDLPLEDAMAFGRASRRREIDSVLLASPTTTEARMKSIVANTSGFLYLVSVLGVTGARKELKEGTVNLVKFARTYTAGKIPLAVGFGISSPEQVRTVIEAGADAAVVGSAIVDRAARRGAEGRKGVEGYVRSLKSAAEGARQAPRAP